MIAWLTCMASPPCPSCLAHFPFLHHQAYTVAVQRQCELVHTGLVLCGCNLPHSTGGVVPPCRRIWTDPSHRQRTNAARTRQACSHSTSRLPQINYYEIWTAHGCIHGQADQHWLAAERETLTESTAPLAGVQRKRRFRARSKKSDWRRELRLVLADRVL